MKTKIQKYAGCILALAALAIFCPILAACEKTDIYALAEKLIYGGGAYSFEADMEIGPKNNSDSAIPNELVFKISGRAKDGDAEIEVALVGADGEDVRFELAIHKRQELLCFELNEFSGIIADLLCSTDVLDVTLKNLFESMAGYDGTLLYLDPEEVWGADWLERILAKISETFEVKSSVAYDYSEDPEIPEYEFADGLSFGKIMGSMEKELLKFPYYRYAGLHVVLETAGDGINYINVLATRESGQREILEKRRIDSDLTKARNNPESAYRENILPMRYLMELLGETVGWDENKKSAYILNGGNKVYFEGELINSTTYIPLDRFVASTDYAVDSVLVGEYIEFELWRK
ncbi:MAG: copper amine oxidase N-terminal domain-containing protein [Oscillospiraceae bacterium]|nr:copper amine oxidase N-terminal domain-containing protein [Oscillospiraceae bacterium]